jgi:hypothetical protein
MCMVSNIGDVYGKKWTPLPEIIQQPVFYPVSEVSRAEFDALRKEVVELKKLLEAAKRFDEATGQPDCEMGEKIAILRKVAEAVGVNLDDVFKPTSAPAPPA